MLSCRISSALYTCHFICCFISLLLSSIAWLLLFLFANWFKQQKGLPLLCYPSIWFESMLLLNVVSAHAWLQANETCMFYLRGITELLSFFFFFQTTGGLRMHAWGSSAAFSVLWDCKPGHYIDRQIWSAQRFCLCRVCGDWGCSKCSSAQWIWAPWSSTEGWFTYLGVNKVVGNIC